MSNQCHERTSPANSAGADGGRASGAGQETSSDDGEEQEESSSSHSLNNNLQGNECVEKALTSFREQWQREIEKSPQKDGKLPTKELAEVLPETENVSAIETKATNLFLKGVELEENGKLYDAIHFYRKAVQLVPDIEFRLYDHNKHKSVEQPVLRKNEDETPDHLEESEDKGPKDESDMLLRLERHFSRTNCVCTPQYKPKGTHISALPMEIMLYIMRWVVSNDLDMRSLEMCARVCRGFYLCSRDPKIWHLACIKVWGVNCGDLNPYKSWRQMFIKRPRLHFNGLYISKTSYVRYGENNFQDQFYRPCQLVDYFRYLRFFPEGVVLMLTTPEEPVNCLSQFQHQSSKHPSMLTGHYRVHGSRVVIILHRQACSTNNNNNNNRLRSARNRRGDIAADTGEQTFHLELKIMDHRKRVHVQLVWECYTIYTKFCNGNESSTSFVVQSNRYPPFWFSRVKSYTAVSENLLQ